MFELFVKSIGEMETVVDSFEIIGKLRALIKGTPSKKETEETIANEVQHGHRNFSVF